MGFSTAQIRRIPWLFFAAIALSLPHTCWAYVTWGDFHVFAVIFFSFLGGFLGLGAIFGAIYFACGKHFLNRHQQEVAQTHREHHPWPPGSARWHLQQMIKSDRRGGTSSHTRFPIQKALSQSGQSSRGVTTYPPSTGAYYPDATGSGAPASLYQRALDYCGAGGALDRQPIISTLPADYYTQQAAAYAASFERPTYFTPSGEKSLGPLHEEFEEYRITREESLVSSTGGGGSAALPKIVVPEGAETAAQQQQIQQQQQLQQQQIMRTTSTTTRSSRRHSPQSAGRAPNTYI